MALHIFNNTGDRLEMNALFIQPTRYCARNCKGCYVKEHILLEKHVHPEVWADLCDKLHYNPKVSVNQVTVSIDDLPKDITEADHMIAVFKKIYYRWLFFRQKYDPLGIAPPELHMTFHTTSTFQEYATQQSFVGDIATAKVLDLVSFSTIKNTKNELEFIKHLMQYTKVNYNHTCPPRISSKNVDKYLADLTAIGKVVDSIYMIMHKTPIGKPRDTIIEILDRDRMRNDIQYMKSVLERLPADVRNKINLDGCLEDSVRCTSTGFGCSSNVSRFQVWSDGSVSGCPYAFRADTGPTETADGILLNILRARQRYDFNDCHLSDVLNHITRRPKDRGKAI